MYINCWVTLQCLRRHASLYSCVLCEKKKDEGDQGRHPGQPVEATYTSVHLNLDGHSNTVTQSIISVAMLPTVFI